MFSVVTIWFIAFSCGIPLSCLMVFNFLIWYSRSPPAAGRERGKEREIGGHPRTPGHGTASPGTPCCAISRCCTSFKKQTPSGGPRRGEEGGGDAFQV